MLVVRFSAKYYSGVVVNMFSHENRFCPYSVVFTSLYIGADISMNWPEMVLLQTVKGQKVNFILFVKVFFFFLSCLGIDLQMFR